MNRFWAIPVLLAAAACASVPSTPARPRPVSDQQTPEADGSVRLAREEWFLKRRQEADGTVPVDAFGRAQERLLACSLSHGAAKAAVASPFDGRIWEEIGPRNIAGRVLSVAFDPKDPDVLWAGSAGGGLYRSGGFGRSGRRMGRDHLPCLWIGAIAIDTKNPQILYMGTGDPNTNVHFFGGFGGLLKTGGGGLTFPKLPGAEGAFFRTLVSAADSNLVLTAGKTGLYRSADAGGHFAKVLTGEITDFAQDPKSPARLVAVKATTSASHADSGLFESLDAGLTWHPLGTGLPDGMSWGRGALAFPPAPSTVMYLALALTSGAQPSGLFRSADDGRTWTRQATDREN